MCSPRWWAVRPVSQRHSEQLWSVGGAEAGSHWWWSPSWCRYFCSKEPGAGSSTWPDLVLDIIQGKLLLICCYLSVTESRWLCHDLAILRLIINIPYHIWLILSENKELQMSVWRAWWIETKFAILLIGIILSWERFASKTSGRQRVSETHFLVPRELEPNNWGIFILTLFNVYLHIGPRLLYDLRTCKCSQCQWFFHKTLKLLNYKCWG